LERGFDSAPDRRVPFSPDGWQSRVLDAIDANKSLFVVAPTSSGKTFISFYAMKKVLQSSDDDILVYVAPTKALVNQIAAEVQARFSKAYSKAGRSVWAVHTRDYRINNPTGCQVLITVPHILQIMLLAPSNSKTANSWSLRVKRIIFDEIHCIGQSDEGVIWEQLLLLAPCPIIALSATVGNPAEFSAWLGKSEEAKGHDLETIIHSSRHSDLRKFIYCPLEKQAFTGLKPVEGFAIPGLDEQQHLQSPFAYIHPVTSLINRYVTALEFLTLWLAHV
jgi:superfamily II RNA helicase